MRALIDAIEAEAFGPVRHILHVGIGGSALGPDLLMDALGRDAGRYDVAIVSNVDGCALEEQSGFLPEFTPLWPIVSLYHHRNDAHVAICCCTRARAGLRTPMASDRADRLAGQGN